MTAGGMPLLDAIEHVLPIGMVWILGVLLIWGHVCDASKCWERDREQREARRRLKRSTAAWKVFHAEHIERTGARSG